MHSFRSTTIGDAIGMKRMESTTHKVVKAENVEYKKQQPNTRCRHKENKHHVQRTIIIIPPSRNESTQKKEAKTKI